MVMMKFVCVRIGEKADLKAVGYVHAENDARELYEIAVNSHYAGRKTIGFIHNGELVAEFRKFGENYKLVYSDPIKIRNIKNGKIVW